ncbi:hypothetical protein MGSAQ_001663 [marine sediment metagenome]|uniref:Uncharacterized protein n=1 Tax=marine sediment metagenome TaxID=412755 RepID=A0A1B6NTN7_9ZZZZ
MISATYSKATPHLMVREPYKSNAVSKLVISSSWVISTHKHLAAASQAKLASR